MNKTSPGSAVQWIEVDAEAAGQRIDNFLFARLKGVPKSHIYRILRTGEVRRNGGRVQAQARIDAGDLIRLPPVRQAIREPHDGVPKNLADRLEARVLYEDDDLLAIAKPAGMAVHGGSGVNFGVIEGFREIRPQARFLELVHRLDRDTSGCLLIAKKRSALRVLHEQFRGDAVRKTYVALLSGNWARKHCEVNAPLQKNVLQSGERMVKVSREGRLAVTVFRRLQKFSDGTLVEASPLTGRTHQIRVHAKHIGHPIAADDRYGDAESNRRFRQAGLKRLFLHAAETSFPHPRTGKPLTVSAPLEADLQEFLDRLAS